MKVNFSRMRFFPAWLLMLIALSCSHDYDSDTLDLVKYQWNMWPEMGADPGSDAIYKAGANLASFPINAPSCGWDDLDRGMGKLVRIPAIQESNFEVGEQSSVVWFHVRHTLPELWAERDITLHFGGVSFRAEVYLNGELVGAYLGANTPFSMDITDKVYYVRDNHLSIRVYDPDPGSCGITGKIIVVSKPFDQAPTN